jgi:hypothetical protein
MILLPQLLLVILLTIPNVGSLRILYLVTSSSSSNKDGSNRWNSTIIPVVHNAIESFKSYGYAVDLYLILSYSLSDGVEKLIRSSLPSSVGIEIWNDATPFDIPPLKDNTKRRMKQIPKALSRQHRFVIKDKLFAYDFFVAMEDDMLVLGEHVQYHLQVTHRIHKLSTEAPDTVPVPTGQVNTDTFHGNLTKAQLARLWPGFLRVEVLQEGSESKEELDEIPVLLNGLWLNASRCCRMLNQPVPSNQSLMIWETGAAGLSVREIPGVGWVVLFQGPTYLPEDPARITGYYPYADFNLTHIPIAIPSDMYMAQTGGWMATRQQILELHLNLCQGSFLPPYDQPHFWNDGIWGHNSGVEFWSGGMQMWTQRDGCNIQRILRLEDLSNALLYHTSNNKQRSIKRHRRVLALNLLGQLHSLIRAAKSAKQKESA